MLSERVGILVLNLGTPEAPTAQAVRPYLRQFLSDPRVIDIPAALRWLLVNVVIVPFRSPKSAEAYATVWGENGSPLLHHGRRLVDALSEALGPHPVRLGMRYGNPSIAQALQELMAEGVDRIVVFPLFPQYASASYGSALQEVYEQAGRMAYVPSIAVVPPFYDDAHWVEAVRAVSQPVLEEFAPDFVLLSYHGIPERQCKATDFGAHCFARADCCDRIQPQNRACYRAQCMASSRALVAALNLPEGGYETTFQSRLGRTPWIQPFTDEVVPALAKKGVKRLAVLCPSFTADCLETIEEIGDRAAADFKAAGGEALRLVPCLNADPAWVRGAEALLQKHL